MRRNIIETVLGAVVLLVAGFFLVFAYTSADLRAVSGYEVTARFANITGLQTGADVRISGVKVGTVVSQTLDSQSFLAVVRLSVDPKIRLPRDTVALVASEGLLGGKFMALEPGGDTVMIEPGGRIDYTQSTPGLEQLLGQVIFNLQGSGNKNEGTAPHTGTPGDGMSGMTGMSGHPHVGMGSGP